MSRCVLGRMCLPVAVAFACIVAQGQVAQTAELRLGNMKAGKVLFLGNSITLSPPGAAPGWNNNWGMAASAESKDYVHLVTTFLAQRTGGTPTIMASNIAASFERGYTAPTGYDVNTVLAAQLPFKADIVVVELGANVLSSLNSDADKTLFRQRFTELLTTLKSNSQPEIFVTGCIIGSDMAAKNEVERQACAATGSVYVDLSAFGQDPLNFANAQGIYSDPGVGSHPSDKGMTVIAHALQDSMVTRSVPEPGTKILLGTALIGMLICGWRNWKCV